MKNALIFCFLSFQTTLWAQDTLSLKDLLFQSKGLHPVERQANIGYKMAQLKLLEARGGFDPKFNFEHQEKDFKDVDYYSITKSEIKVPTWYGIDVKGGYEVNTGQYLNPERNTPVDGLGYLEISAPVLQNLLLDERRSQLRVAQAGAQAEQFNRTVKVNELHYLISSSYWNWFETYENQKLYQDAVTVANTRLQAVKRSVELGTYAVIDTVEAFMELKRREAILQEIEAFYANSYYGIFNHIWTEDSTPDLSVIPVFKLPLVPNELQAVVDSFRLERHPALTHVDFKLDAAGIQRNLYKQQFLPDIRLNYKPLVTGTNVLNYSTENYTWRASAQIPILYRKQKAKYQLANAKIEQLTQERQFKRRALANEVDANSQALQYLLGMMDSQEAMVAAAQKMLSAEKRRFELGDATIFMINYRERYLLEAQSKLIKTQKEVGKTQAALLYKLGTNVNNMPN